MANDFAIVGVPMVATINQASNLCARVYDARGVVTDPTAFTLQVVHP
jgi:hypothetical protein